MTGSAGQPDPEEKGPRRRCVATRESLPKEAMIRFVLGPDRVLVPDLSGRMPGRGMWLSARGDVLERALTRGAFMKAARGPVHPIPDLRDTIVDGLRRRIRDAVGLARRAGQAVVGFQQAREWLQNGRAALLVEASDGSAPERARLVGHHGVPVVSVLGAAELGSVFGRDHAVHVAVAPGRLAEGILAEAGRLSGMLSTAPAPDAPGGRGGRKQGRDAGRKAGAGAPSLPNEASPDSAEKAGPRGAGQDGAPRRGADRKAPQGGAGGPAPRKGGRQGTRPRRGGEPAVPVTQER
ncbi:RNA-binding protein [Roseomonas sp. SG15]|uniref:RNA-binding protein n=2 Tax=Roseomonas indoligenes TaxID=2820811 RepID=A0A940N0G5_9PROT|nr:RNA-binding protein [Pararoseomonas indoligenes]MBP0493816.1 RNA-binding protein [Pararoseomonas indoligenes]